MYKNHEFFSCEDSRSAIKNSFNYSYLSDDIYIQVHIDKMFAAVEDQNATELEVLLSKEVPISRHYRTGIIDQQFRPVVDFKQALQHALFYAAKKGYKEIVDIISESEIIVSEYASLEAKALVGKLDSLCIEAAFSLLENSKSSRKINSYN